MSSTSPIFAFDPSTATAMQSDFASFSFSMPPHAAAADTPPKEAATCQDDESMLRHWAAYVAASSGMPSSEVTDTATGSCTPSLVPSRASPVTFSQPAAPPRRASAPYVASRYEEPYSRPTSSSSNSKRKLAHLEVERERRRSIACGFATLQRTLHPHSSADAGDGGESAKAMSKSVLLRQACNTINELRVRLEASTAIIANLNVTSTPQRTPSSYTYTPPLTTPTDTSPSSVCSTSSSSSSSTPMSSSSSWPSSMAMTSIVPPGAPDDKRRQRARAPQPPAYASATSSNTASLTNSPCVPAAARSEDASHELRKAIATLLNCLPVQSESSGGGGGSGSLYRTRRNTPTVDASSPYRDEEDDVVM